MSLHDSGFQHEPVKVDPPRELTQWEHAVLAKMLSLDFEGVEPLREQLQHTRVWEECAQRPGCPVIQLVVDRAKAAPAKLGRGMRPVVVEADTTVHETRIEFDLFVDSDNFLSLLDAYPIGSEWPIQRLPEPEDLEVWPGPEFAPDRWFFTLPDLETLPDAELRDLTQHVATAFDLAQVASDRRRLHGQLDALRSELSRRGGSLGEDLG